jgi:hypothetical protein
MPIFMLSLPLAAVIASFVSLGLAIQHRDPLVSGDYYKQGIAVNERIERDEVAARGNVVADVSFVSDAATSHVLVHLTGHPDLLAVGGPPVLRLLHPSDDQQDLDIKLVPAEVPGWWRANCPTPAPKVAWQMTIETSRWRIGTLVATRPGVEARLVALTASE